MRVLGYILVSLLAFIIFEIGYCAKDWQAKAEIEYRDSIIWAKNERIEADSILIREYRITTDSINTAHILALKK